jgi:DNA recombination protein RmuC
MGFEIMAGWVVALIVAGLALWFRAQKERTIAVLQSDRAFLEQQLTAERAAKGALEQQHEALRGENEQLRSEAIRQESRLDAQIEKHTELLKTFDEQRTHLREEMANTMQKLLEGKIKTFDETSMKGLERLLEPFKENIEGFKKQVQQSQQASAERIAGLSKEIEQVMKAGMSITEEAANLTKALKGEKQTQGRWGEMVLESVLEQSGLIKGEHYRTQESYRDDSGHQKRPDVVVRLPQDRSIIIDSKVSLVDYDSFIRAGSEADRTLSLRRMVEAFYRHIDTLHSKDYAHYEAGTLQYVFMFVPIEAAYALSVQHDPGLYEYALGKHIVIVYPSTLVVTLKTIYLYWQREASDQAVERIFKEAGALYDKVYGFVENFERIGQQLNTVSGTYEKTARQLYSGSGNLLTRTEKLKTLGAKTTKTLKDLRIKNAELDEDEPAALPEKSQKEE